MKEEFDKNKKAVAIKYSPDDVAPKVVAKGRGYIAQKIIENSVDVPKFENKELVQELEKIEVDSNIPKELYEVVAQILVFVSDLDKISKYRKK